MHILIEGVDRAGKDTLALSLSTRLGIPILKDSNNFEWSRGYQDPSALASGLALGFASSFTSLYNAIKVRLHYSNLMYNTDRPGFRFEHERAIFEHIESKVRPVLNVLILLDIDYETYQKRGGDPKEIDQITFERQRDFFRRIPDVSAGTVDLPYRILLVNGCCQHSDLMEHIASELGWAPWKTES